jgi:sugar lactone lactonase YvrE
MVRHTSEVEWKTIQANENASAQWMHSGIAVLSSGRLVYGALGGGGLVVRDAISGERARIDLPLSAAHGIVSVPPTEDGGDERLWIADPGPEPDDEDAPPGAAGQVLEVSLTGEILTRWETPPLSDAQSGSWRPTSVVVIDDEREGRTVWIADGYGQNRVYRMAADGHTTVVDSAAGLDFDCPHGLVLDTRSAPGHDDARRVVVADRGNRRLVFLSLDGSVERVVSGEEMTSPSCLALRGDSLVVTDLFGTVLTVDTSDRIRISAGRVPERGWPGWPNRVVDGRTVPPRLADGVLNSPHGVAVGPDDEVYVTEWMLGGRVVRLDLASHS